MGLSVPNSRLRIFLPLHVNRRNVLSISATKVNDLRETGDLYRSQLPQTTLDLGQFITLSVHVDVQHDACAAARRAGPSATADTHVDVVSQ